MLNNNVCKKDIKYVILFFLAVLIAGCSSTPSESQAKKEFQKHLDENYPGIYKIISLKKTDGEKNTSGVPRYMLYFTATVEVLKDTTGYANSPLNIYGYIENNFNTFKWLKRQDKSSIKRGDRFEGSGRVLFKKTEKGWKKIN